MADHRQRVDAAVGAAGAVHRDGLAGHLEYRALDRFLHRRAVVLPLQPHERAAVELEGEREAGHYPRPDFKPNLVIPAKAGTQGGAVLRRPGFPLSRE